MKTAPCSQHQRIPLYGDDQFLGLPQIYPPQEESVGRSEKIHHGVDTEAQASPKRFAEASTEKKRLLEVRLCQTQSLISSNDLLLEKDGSQFHA